MNKTPTITIRDANGDDVQLPAKFSVCGRCDGRGTHVNPGVDGNGLSREDFDADPDFEEDYFSGVYDVRCEACQGERVVAALDEARCTPAQIAQHATYWQDEADYAAEVAAERRWGY